MSEPHAPNDTTVWARLNRLTGTFASLSAKSDRAFGNAENFVDGGQAARHFLESVFTQGDHAALGADSAKLADVGVAADLVPQRIVEKEQLVQSYSSAISVFRHLGHLRPCPQYRVHVECEKFGRPRGSR